ncbi:thiamine pyrophosphate-requiring protein [Alicyclobacillus shizuokensis]|uniref:thiamine pyrophosphate-requiring protein n=1 Tax=Alicyclobacillus shizuokensis TaxID=392014 RepID=UPI0009F8A576|nr:thiamine pyrophosphate-requiring protein [Alicyclobacillus shizuokensis]MCL6625801.1 thiamine pyrophosphate-requiring protein [Alicyclobacillus shizuokensis]
MAESWNALQTTAATTANRAATATVTASDKMMTTLTELGVDCIFANLGSDHPAIIESWAKLRAQGQAMPRVIICPHEMVALSAAHGYAQATGRLQAVFVHVDVGTQNLGGALHNALRGRVPLLIFAGASPVTLDGEKTGSRNEFIHYLQDISDQRGMVRAYTKWDYDLHVGENIDLVIKRAVQLAQSDPMGPVYLMAPREVLEETVHPAEPVIRHLSPTHPSGLAPAKAREIAAALASAEFPLIITSYLGRNREAVRELVALSEEWAVPVMEAGPHYMNFPADHPMHLGYEDFVHENPYLQKADVVLVLDSDIPWMPQKSRRRAGSTLFWIDVDPLKDTIPLWYYSGEHAFRADICVALRQIREQLANCARKESVLRARRAFVAGEAARLRREWEVAEQFPADGVITPEFLTRTVREVTDEDTVIINEAISNYQVVWRHVRAKRPGCFFGSGASSLGWHGGAAIGVKLAHPDKTVVALTGDGSYIFSVPSAVHLAAAKYEAPFLTVIYNNGGWKSPKLSTLAVHPDGFASRASDFPVDFYPGAQLEKAAEVVPGTYTARVEEPAKLRGVLLEALSHVRSGHSAVVNVVLRPL